MASQHIDTVIKAVMSAIESWDGFSAVPTVMELVKATTQVGTDKLPYFIVAEMGDAVVEENVTCAVYVTARLGIRQVYRDSDQEGRERDMQLIDCLENDPTFGGKCVNSHVEPADRPFNWEKVDTIKWRDRYLLVKYRRDL